VRRTARQVTAPLLALMALAAVATGCSDDRVTEPEPVQRVLIVTMPGVTWSDVTAEDTPNLEALVDHAAIGDISTRIGGFRQSNTAAYLTLGAGTRAVVPGINTGAALNPGETLGGVPASELVQRRLGRAVDGIAYIPVGAAVDANASSPFGAEPGLLGDELEAAGVHRAVIANADAAEGFPVDQPLPDGAYTRSAATALMDSDGIVPAGNVGRDLLRDDPDAPFGRRLDHVAVLRSFDEQWGEPGRSVVLVEASDLARAAGYDSRATPRQGRSLSAEALQSSDVLLGKLLDRVDPETDAVLVLAPTAPGGLGITALQTPDVDGGMVRSASTRRKGYVYLADVAPTVLQLVDAPIPASIEGTPIDAVPASGDRVARLERQADAAQVRADRLPLAVTIVTIALILLALAVALRDRLAGWQQGLLRPLAFAATVQHAAVVRESQPVPVVRLAVSLAGQFLCACVGAPGRVEVAQCLQRPGMVGHDHLHRPVIAIRGDGIDREGALIEFALSCGVATLVFQVRGIGQRRRIAVGLRREPFVKCERTVHGRPHLSGIAAN